jgi:dolichol-phosphate mannosyltransferase
MVMKKVFIITPVLNEEGNIPRLIHAWGQLRDMFTDYQFHFILVNDGSTDGTVSAVHKYVLMYGIENHYTVLSHEYNQGPGVAFSTAFIHLSSILDGDDVVITMEGDNTSKIEIIATMLGRLDRENVDVVLASPYAYGGGVLNTNLVRVVLSFVANGIIRIFLGIHGIHTMSSFFRAFQGKTILALQRRFSPGIIEMSGFECMVEMLKKIVILGFTVSEVPMRLDTSLRAGKSKMKILRTIMGYIRVSVRGKQWETIHGA